MDGLVSTGKTNSLHNIKKSFTESKNFFKQFYSHFKTVCEFVGLQNAVIGMRFCFYNNVYIFITLLYALIETLMNKGFRRVAVFSFDVVVVVLLCFYSNKKGLERGGKKLK